MIGFHITDRCQLNCDHCLRDPGMKALDIDVDLIRRVLPQTRVYNVEHVALTGGEPTLHPDFVGIIDAIVDNGMTWHMVSNGVTFDRVLEKLDARPERLQALGMVDFSLDGATEATHDSIRGDGSYRAVMAAVSMCVVRSIPFLLQMTVNARNEHELEQLALVAAQLGATRISFNFTQPTATFLDRNLYVAPHKAEQIVDRIRRMQGAFAMPISITDMFPQPTPFAMCVPWRFEMFHVDVQGRLTLCCQLAGIPSAGSEVPLDVIADLNEVPFTEAHRRMIDHVGSLMKRRVDHIAKGSDDPWQQHQCNWCLKEHGKPHWSEGGQVSGPEASRERWRGAWAPGYKPSHAEAKGRSGGNAAE